MLHFCSGNSSHHTTHAAEKNPAVKTFLLCRSEHCCLHKPCSQNTKFCPSSVFALLWTSILRLCFGSRLSVIIWHHFCISLVVLGVLLKFHTGLILCKFGVHAQGWVRGTGAQWRDCAIQLGVLLLHHWVTCLQLHKTNMKRTHFQLERIDILTTFSDESGNHYLVWDLVQASSVGTLETGMDRTGKWENPACLCVVVFSVCEASASAQSFLVTTFFVWQNPLVLAHGVRICEEVTKCNGHNQWLKHLEFFN